MTTTAPTAAPAEPTTGRGSPPRPHPTDHRRIAADRGGARRRPHPDRVRRRTEPVITGSALLGFAAGWAMLAVLSARMTDQPQRWAWVPAAALGATGLGLLILAPDDRVLTAAGWAWPPLLLALAVWMVLRIRRSLAAGSGRWLLYPVVAVMAAAAVGGAVETVGLAADQRAYAMPGQLLRRRRPPAAPGLHRLRRPHRRAESGLGEFSANWARIAPLVAGPPGSAPTTAPGRAGARTRPPAGRAAGRRRPAHPAEPRRRARPVRAGRALDRRRPTR